MDKLSYQIEKLSSKVVPDQNQMIALHKAKIEEQEEEFIQHDSELKWLRMLETGFAIIIIVSILVFCVHIDLKRGFR